MLSRIFKSIYIHRVHTVHACVFHFSRPSSSSHSVSMSESMGVIRSICVVYVGNVIRHAMTRYAMPLPIQQRWRTLAHTQPHSNGPVRMHTQRRQNTGTDHVMHNVYPQLEYIYIRSTAWLFIHAHVHARTHSTFMTILYSMVWYSIIRTIFSQCCEMFTNCSREHQLIVECLLRDQCMHRWCERNRVYCV